jgi:hypothetical protein
MNRPNLRHATATLACVASLGGAGAVLAPGAATAAPGAQSCGAKVITIPTKGGEASKVPVSRISVRGGATCRDAYAVIRGVVTKKLPRGWSVAHGNFKVPSGLVPQVAVKGHKKVMFALPGNGG